MKMNAIAAAVGLGAAAGAVAILMVPRQNPARRLAYQAAARVEDAATMMTDKLNQKLDQM